nr:hypothetical protein [Tanacetum cinerariifolium]
MLTLTFADTYNLVAFLEKPSESEVDKQKVIITEESIRHDLKFDDVEGTACLPNDTIFVEFARIGAKTTAWNEFSSTMASAIISLANNQKFNFSKYILDNMVKHLEGGVKFLMFLKFLQVFLDKQEKRTGFSENVTPLFKTMMVIAHEEVGKVLDLEEAKITQAMEIAKLKKRVKKLEKRIKSRPAGLRRLKKVGTSKQVESFKEKDSLGAQVDASKQGRDIEYIDLDTEIALVDECQGRMQDAYMFGVDDLEGNEVFVEKSFEKNVSTADPLTIAGKVVTAASVEDSAAPTTATTTDVDDELTLAKTLIAIKAAKPKVILTAITTPRAKGIVFQAQVQAHKPTVSSSKDKGKTKMIEPEKPLKRKIKSHLMKRQLTKQIHAQEKEQISIKERSKLLAELIKSKRKYFAAKRAEEIRNKPPTKAQQRSLMCTYMRNMRVNSFVDMDTENVEESLKKTEVEGSFKRAGQELDQESVKKQKLAEQEQDKVADDDTA